MILKSRERYGAWDLAEHLTNADENERIIVLGGRHLIADDDVHSALRDMYIIAQGGLGSGGKCRKHMHHVMMNPGEALTDDEWDRAWELYEDEFGLQDQPFIEVEHHKEGRTHRHRVYDRLRENAPAIEFSFSKTRNEKLSRILEHEFGHDLTVGKHNKAVINRLREDGLDQVADWMEQGRAHEVERPVAAKSHADHQMEKRTGLKKADAERVIREAWDQSDSGKSLNAALSNEGLILAKGDRIVVVDQAGGVHSLARRLPKDIKAKQVRKRLSDLGPNDLPDVDQARAQQAELMRQHEQALQERKAEADRAPEQEPIEAVPDREDISQVEPPEADKTASNKRKRKQQIKDALDKNAIEHGKDSREIDSDPAADTGTDKRERKKRIREELDQQDIARRKEEEKRRRQQIEARRQQQEDRRRAAEKAQALKEQLRDEPEGETSSILQRAREAVTGGIFNRAVSWVRERLFGRSAPQQEQQKPEQKLPDQNNRDSIEKPAPDEKQREPEKEKEKTGSKYEIIDLDDPDLEVKKNRRGIRMGRSDRDKERDRGDRDRDDDM